jgi:hypothetical protein
MLWTAPEGGAIVGTHCYLWATLWGGPMARPTRLAMTATVTLVVLALSLTSFAADKASTTFVADPGCIFCTFDSITKGSLTMSSATARGTNGVKFKFSLSGATSRGFPINGATFRLVLRLSFNGGPCDAFASPPFEMVNGKANAIFDGSSLTPPIPEGGGSFFFFCEAGAFMMDMIDGSAPARAGVRLGIDPD